MKNSNTTVPSSKAAPEILIWRGMRVFFFTVVFTVGGLIAILWLMVPKGHTSVENKNLCTSFSVGMNQIQVQDALDRHGPPYWIWGGHGQIMVEARDSDVACNLAVDGNGIVVSVVEKGSR